MTDLPLARIKRIIKADPDVKNVASDAVNVMSYAAVLFAETLSKESFKYTSDAKRKTLQYVDVAKACKDIDQFDFLHEIVPIPKISK
ncbi:hypothetical protein GEMRC1_001466 [Eukaryota sp. GEM-RC1]